MRPVSLTSSVVSGWSSMPAAMLVITEKPSRSSPQCAAVSASVTVYMPTASPPKSRIARISAGVSNCGPGMKK